ncbi:transposase [Anabaena sp. FACHB-1237]|nr:transposase [Anabaena sp. FACHB-1237]
MSLNDEFKRQLEYKAKNFGCEIIIADRFYPSFIHQVKPVLTVVLR